MNDAKVKSLTTCEEIVHATQYLSATKRGIEANEDALRKCEAQLERQRVLYQVLCVLAVGGGIALAY